MCTIWKNLFYLTFLCCFYENFQAEEKDQSVNLENLNLGNIDLENLKNLFDTEEIKQIFEREKISEILGKNTLPKNYFYSTNIGLGLHNNFADIGHKFQNWHNSNFRFNKTKSLIKENLKKYCDGDQIGNSPYNEKFSGFYKYKNFVQSLLSKSFYINPSWNFQLKKSNFFVCIGIFFEKTTCKYSYDFVFAKKKEEDINEKDNNHKNGEKDDGFLRTNVSTRCVFDSLKLGPSFGFSWYSNKIYPWASWNINLMLSLGFLCGFSDFFDFSFFKCGGFYLKKEFKFENKNNPNVKNCQEGTLSLFPFYFLFQFSVGYNKFSIWFRIYSPFMGKTSFNTYIIPEGFRTKINDDFKSEFLDSNSNLDKESSFHVLFENWNFAFGFSYIF